MLLHLGDTWTWEETSLCDGHAKQKHAKAQVATIVIVKLVWQYTREIAQRMHIIGSPICDDQPAGVLLDLGVPGWIRPIGVPEHKDFSV
jgi:hypothetical protein